MAIGLAIWLKDVYIALFAGLYSGCLLLAGGNPWLAFLNMFNGDKHGVSYVLADPWNMQVLIFTLFLGAMVQIMSDSGGTRAVVQRLSGVTTTRERGQLLTWFAGLLIFFDDYANTMLVGNSMRPVTDRLKISREKLAFLIDSTAAPIAGLAIVSTWVGVELGAIKDGLASLATDETTRKMIPALKDQIFMGSIPYRFYPIFLIGFVMLIAATGRDYGAMLKAEKDALDGDGPKDDGDCRGRQVLDLVRDCTCRCSGRVDWCWLPARLRQRRFRLGPAAAAGFVLRGSNCVGDDGRGESSDLEQSSRSRHEGDGRDVPSTGRAGARVGYLVDLQRRGPGDRELHR